MKLVRELQDAKLIVASRGNYIDYYSGLAADEGVSGNVIFAGFISEGEVIGYFNRTDLLILPSCDLAEGFGGQRHAQGVAAGSKVGNPP